MNCKEIPATLRVDGNSKSGNKEANTQYTTKVTNSGDYAELFKSFSDDTLTKGSESGSVGVNTSIKIDLAEQNSVKIQGKLLPPQEVTPRGNIKLSGNNGVTNNHSTRASSQQHSIDAKYRVIKRQYNANREQKNISKDTWNDLEVYIEDYCKRRSRRYGMESMGKVYNVAWGLANGRSKCKSCTEKGTWKLYCPHNSNYEYKIQAMDALNTAVNIWVSETDNREMYGIKQNMETIETDEDQKQSIMDKNPEHETQYINKDD